MTNWEFFMGNGIHQMKVFQVPTPTAQILFEVTMYMASAVQRKKITFELPGTWATKTTFSKVRLGYETLRSRNFWLGGLSANIFTYLESAQPGLSDDAGGDPIGCEMRNSNVHFIACKNFSGKWHPAL